MQSNLLAKMWNTGHNLILWTSNISQGLSAVLPIYLQQLCLIKTCTALFLRLALEYSISHKTFVGLKAESTQFAWFSNAYSDWKGGREWLPTFIASHHCNWQEGQGKCRDWGWQDLWKPSGSSLTLSRDTYRQLHRRLRVSPRRDTVPLLDKNTLNK